MSLEQFVNDITKYYYSETPVSTALVLSISGLEKQEPLRKELIYNINKNSIYRGRKIELDFYGEDGLYISRTKYTNLVKNILIKKAVSDFHKNYPNYKVYYIISSVANYELEDF